MKVIKSKKGYALVTVIAVLAIASIFALVTLNIYDTDYKATSRTLGNKQAYYLAESGAKAVAAYLITNPDELANILGTSDAFKIDPTSDDYCVVTVSEDSNFVYLNAVGTVVSTIDYSETAQLILSKEVGLGLDYALYVENTLHIKNNVEIDGDVAMKGTASDYTEDNNAEILGDLEFNVDYTFDPPTFPNYPSVSNNNGTDKPSSLNHDTYYNNGVELDKVDIVINVGASDYIVKTSYFIGKQSSITINRSGAGKFILYVEDAKAFELDKCDFNEAGSHDDAIIYFESDDKDFLIKNGSDVKADIFITESPKVDIQSGTTRYDGHMAYLGDGVVIVENNAGWDNGLLYAPNAYVNFKNNTRINGVVIAKDLLLENFGHITFQAIDESPILGGGKTLIETYMWGE